MNLLDFSNVTNMKNTFNGCTNIRIIYTPTFTSKVTDVYGLFNGCSTLYRVNLSDSDTSGVSNFGYMFYNCKTLSNINGTIDMKSCTDYTNMFYGLRLRILLVDLMVEDYHLHNIQLFLSVNNL